MNSKSIIVTGANGQIGQELSQLQTQFSEYTFYFFSRQELDICDKADLQKIKALKPFALINTAAYTAVDKAEADAEACYKINFEAVKNLVELSNELNCILIHYSSDYVYDLPKSSPILETDSCNPRGIYAKSKLEGDQYIEAFCKKYVILRTSWVYSSFGHNFVKTMLKLAKTHSSLKIVNDQVGSPTNAFDLALASLEILHIINHNPNFEYNGVYNYSNEGTTNWMEFAKKIFEIKGKNVQVDSISTEDYNAPAPRPLWSVMSKDKIINTFNLTIPTWEFSLQKCLDKL